jgi:hypothetical protein
VTAPSNLALLQRRKNHSFFLAALAGLLCVAALLFRFVPALNDALSGPPNTCKRSLS